MDQRLDTVKKLYDWSSNGYGNKGRISITCNALAALCAYATSIGVQGGHRQHADVIAMCRTKAQALRYRYMALTVLPESNYLYDYRHSEADEFGDWESDLLILDDKEEK